MNDCLTFGLIENKLLDIFPDSNDENIEYKVVKIFNYTSKLFVLFNRINKNINKGNSTSENCLFLFYYEKDKRLLPIDENLNLYDISNKNEKYFINLNSGIYKNSILIKDSSNNRNIYVLKNNEILKCNMDNFIKNLETSYSNPVVVNYPFLLKNNEGTTDIYNIERYMDIVEESIKLENIKEIPYHKDISEDYKSKITEYIDNDKYINNKIDCVNLLNDKIYFCKIDKYFLLLKNRVLIILEIDEINKKSIIISKIKFNSDVIMCGVNNHVFINEINIQKNNEELFINTYYINSNSISKIKKVEDIIKFNIIIPNEIKNNQYNENILKSINENIYKDEYVSKVSYTTAYDIINKNQDNIYLFISINGRVLIINNPINIKTNLTNETTLEAKDFYQIKGNVKEIYIEEVDIDANKYIVITNDKSEIYIFENLLIENYNLDYENNTDNCIKYIYNFNNESSTLNDKTYYRKSYLPKIINTNGSIDSISLCDLYINTLNTELIIDDNKTKKFNSIKYFKLSNPLELETDLIQIEGKDEDNELKLNDNGSYMKIEVIPNDKKSFYNNDTLIEDDYLYFLNMRIKINGENKIDDEAIYKFNSNLINLNNEEEIIKSAIKIDDNNYYPLNYYINENGIDNSITFEDDNVYKNIYYLIPSNLLYNDYFTNVKFIGTNIPMKIKYYIENSNFKKEYYNRELINIPSRFSIRDIFLVRDTYNTNKYILYFRFRYLNTFDIVKTKLKFKAQISNILINTEEGKKSANCEFIYDKPNEFVWVKLELMSIFDSIIYDDLYKDIKIDFYFNYVVDNTIIYSNDPAYTSPTISLKKIKQLINDKYDNDIEIIEHLLGHIENLENLYHQDININNENINEYINKNYMPLKQEFYDKEVSVNKNNFISNGNKINEYANDYGLVELNQNVSQYVTDEKRIFNDVYINGLKLFNTLYFNKDLNNGSSNLYFPLYSLNNYIPHIDDKDHLNVLLNDAYNNSKLNLGKILSNFEVTTKFGSISEEEKLLCKVNINKTTNLNEYQNINTIGEYYIMTPYDTIEINDYRNIRLFIPSKKTKLTNLVGESNINLYILFNNKNKIDEFKYAKRINPKFYNVEFIDNYIKLTINGLYFTAPNLENSDISIYVTTGTLKNPNLFFNKFEDDVEYIELENILNEDNFQVFSYLSNNIETSNDIEVIANGYTLYPNIDYSLIKTKDLFDSNLIAFRNIIPNDVKISMEINLMPQHTETCYLSNQAYCYLYKNNTYDKYKIPYSKYITLDNDKYQLVKDKFELFINNRKVPNDLIELIDTKTIKIKTALDYRKTVTAIYRNGKYTIQNKIDDNNLDKYTTFDPEYESIMIRFQKTESPYNYDISLLKKYEKDNFISLMKNLLKLSCYTKSNSVINNNFDWLCGEDYKTSSINKLNLLFNSNTIYDCNKEINQTIMLDSNSLDYDFIEDNINIDCNPNK